jgi:outer membrane autotransporter protein
VTVIAPALTAKNFSATTPADKAYAVNLIQAGDVTVSSSVSASSLVVTITTPPTHGTATVASQTITYTSKGTFAGNDTIGYSVSDGYSSVSATETVTVQAPPQVQHTIPTNIIGMTQAQATAALQSAGFVVKVITAQSATVPFGDVITSLPVPGTLANPGTPVQLTVSLHQATSASAPISSVSGLTGPQTSVARGVENTCTTLHGAAAQGISLSAAQKDLLGTCTAIVNGYAGGQNLAGLQNTLNAISGRQMNSPQQAGVLFTAGQSANIAQRFSELRNGAQGISFSGLDLGLPSGVSEITAPIVAMLKGVIGGGAGDDKSSLIGSRLGIFINGNFTRGSQSTTEDEQGFDLQSNALTLGVDYRFTNRLTIGVAAGYAKSTSEFDGSGGTLDAKSYSGTLYGMYDVNGFFINGLLNGGHNTYNSIRDIVFSTNGAGGGALSCAGSSCITTAQGSTGARQLAVGLASGYDFRPGALVVGPDISVNYAKINVDAFDENGPSGLNLAYAEQSGTSVRLKMGGHLSYNLSTRYCVIAPQIMARYVHEFNNDQQAENVRFVADTFTVSGFQVFTDQPDRNFFEYGAGITFQFPFNIAGYIDYESVSGLQDVSVHTFSVGLRVQPGSKN